MCKTLCRFLNHYFEEPTDCAKFELRYVSGHMTIVMRSSLEVCWPYVSNIAIALIQGFTSTNVLKLYFSNIKDRKNDIRGQNIKVRVSTMNISYM